MDIQSLFGNIKEVKEVSQALLSSLETGTKGKDFDQKIVGMNLPLIIV